MTSTTLDVTIDVVEKVDEARRMPFRPAPTRERLKPTGFNRDAKPGQEAPCFDYPRFIQVALVSVYLLKACRDLSRPLPLCL